MARYEVEVTRALTLVVEADDSVMAATIGIEIADGLPAAEWDETDFVSCTRLKKDDVTLTEENPDGR